MMNMRRGGDKMSKKYDELLHTLCIYDSVEKVPYEGCIFLKDGKIANVEKGSIKKEYLEKADTVTECGDKTVCAGFGDTHTFFTGYVIEHLGVDFSDCHSIEQLEKKITAQKDIVHVMFGNHLEKKFVKNEAAEKMLERVMPDKAVVLFTEGHATCLMNKKAKEEFRFDEDHCYSEAIYKIMPLYLNDRFFIEKELISYMKLLNSRGITSVKEMGFDDFYGFTDILAELESENALTIRVNFMSQPVAEPFNLSYGKEMREKFKREFVRFSGYNQMTDGSISELCGDLKKPYSCADTTCAQDIDWDLLANDTFKADTEGFRFSLHAQGDAAISKVLDIYDSCQKDENGKLINRHSITDLEFSDPTDLERMGKLGVIAEIYPQIQSIANRKDKLAMIEEKIGMDRGQYYWNRRKMADSNVLLSCGTDLPLLIDDIPESIYHAVGGYFPEGGEPFNKQNMLTIPELLTAWSAGGAYNLYQEKELGTLEKGKKADIVVFDGNLFETAIEEIRSRKVEVTFLNGRIVYSHE